MLIGGLRHQLLYSIGTQHLAGDCFHKAVNPGNPVISRHVVRRQPPIALENKYCKRNEKKGPGKGELLLNACLKRPGFLR